MIMKLFYSCAEYSTPSFPAHLHSLRFDLTLTNAAQTVPPSPLLLLLLLLLLMMMMMTTMTMTCTMTSATANPRQVLLYA